MDTVDHPWMCEGWDDVQLDLGSWTRLPEVDQYAIRRGLTRGEAIRDLVNSGLSHWHDR